MHVEYFSQCSINCREEYHQHYAGPGVHYLITPDLKIGVRVFWSLNDDALNSLPTPA